jgi:hypothetical protein
MSIFYPLAVLLYSQLLSIQICLVLFGVLASGHAFRAVLSFCGNYVDMWISIVDFKLNLFHLAHGVSFHDKIMLLIKLSSSFTFEVRLNAEGIGYYLERVQGAVCRSSFRLRQRR